RLHPVGQPFRSCRSKFIHAGSRHDDAIAVSMSFFNDTQEFPAIVLAELHVEILALNLQFSRLDDVIHFFLPPPTLPQPVCGMEEKKAAFWHFSQRGTRCPFGPKAHHYLRASPGVATLTAQSTI